MFSRVPVRRYLLLLDELDPKNHWCLLNTRHTAAIWLVEIFNPRRQGPTHTAMIRRHSVMADERGKAPKRARSHDQIYHQRVHDGTVESGKSWLQRRRRAETIHT